MRYNCLSVSFLVLSPNSVFESALLTKHVKRDCRNVEERGRREYKQIRLLAGAEGAVMLHCSRDTHV
jgi:hypothetical protein